MQGATEKLPGVVALLGSGETAPAGRKIFNRLLAAIESPRPVAVLDSPAGFQPNCQLVAEKVAQFISTSLSSLQPQVKVVATRRDDEANVSAVLRAIAAAKFIFAGPGSPTYMIRELADTPCWSAVTACHRQGTALAFSSAAAIAISEFSVPVYEIFKVGAEPFWQSGLNLFAPYGLRLAIVPHWNNQEGGAELDTRYAFLGQARFAAMQSQLPAEVVVLGIDEHTGCVLDFAADAVSVMGTGGAHILRDGASQSFSAGTTFPLALLRRGDALTTLPQAEPLAFLLETAQQLAYEPESEPEAEQTPAQLIDTLLTLRADLRAAKQWQFADRLREALTAAEIVIEDTPQGSRWRRNAD